jgi:CIC family chloride channel protein
MRRFRNLGIGSENGRQSCGARAAEMGRTICIVGVAGLWGVSSPAFAPPFRRRTRLLSPLSVTKPAAAEEVSYRRSGLVALCFYALAVGFVTSIGAYVLRALMALFHNLFFLGTFSFEYDANVFDPPSPWGPFIILAPVIGGLIVVWLVRNFAPEARGPGVAEVLDAIYYKSGVIRMPVIFVKSVASALSIGSGASVGREGPIIHIGSGIGSSIGQLFRLPPWQTITLVAAGAGAGIAATFNTPLGGVMFAIELLLPEVSSRTFLPVVIATGAATYFGWLFFGFEPAFLVPVTGLPELSFPNSFGFLPFYVVLGVICGVAAAAFVRLFAWMENLFEHTLPGNAYVKSAFGMLCVGLLIYVMQVTSGHTHVAGVGYATVQAVLTGEINVGWLLAILFAAKLLATTLSLGAGASGGIFSPSLFMGATLGGSLGAFIQLMWPGLGVNSVMMAVIGMAAVVGSGTGAAMTAILMIFEMTRDYAAVVPSIVAVAVALGVRRTLSYENIYTIKLAWRGHHIPRERHSHMFMIRHAGDIMKPVHGIVTADQLPEATGKAAGGEDGYLIVRKGGIIEGLVHVGGTVDAGEQVVTRNFVIARSDSFIRDVMARMSHSPRGARLAIVVDRKGVPRPEDVLGIVTRSSIAETIISDLSK